MAGKESVWLWRFCLFFCLALGMAGQALADIDSPGKGQPTTVRTYLYLEDVNDINLNTGTYDLTAQLVLKWADPRLAFDSADGSPKVWMGPRAARYLETIWHPILDVSGERGLYSNTVHALSILPDGTVSLHQKFTASPRFTGELVYFPFGRLDLDLAISSVAMDERHLVFELGQLSPADDLIKLDEVLHGNWLPRNIQWQTRSVSFPDKPGRQFAQVRLKIEVVHDFIDGIHKILLPLLVIAMASWGLLWLNFTTHPAFISPRIGGTVTLILTTIALKFALGRELPVVHYLTLSDVLFNATIIVLSFGMLMSCVVAGFLTEYDADRARWHNRWLRVLYPVFYVLLLVLSCLFLL